MRTALFCEKRETCPAVDGAVYSAEV